MAIENLKELFEHELKDIYYAENRLVDALLKVAGECDRIELKRAFMAHQRETRGQVKRLKQVFKLIGVKPEEETCQGIEGLLKEKRKFSREKPTPEILDFFNIGAAQKVEQYEIVAYTNLIEMAQQLGLSEAVTLLQENLGEEQATFEKLRGFGEQFDVSSLIVDENAEAEGEGEDVGTSTQRRTTRARTDTSRRGRTGRTGSRR